MTHHHVNGLFRLQLAGQQFPLDHLAGVMIQFATGGFGQGNDCQGFGHVLDGRLGCRTCWRCVFTRYHGVFRADFLRGGRSLLGLLLRGRFGSHEGEGGEQAKPSMHQNARSHFFQGFPGDRSG